MKYLLDLSDFGYEIENVDKSKKNLKNYKILTFVLEILSSPLY